MTNEMSPTVSSDSDPAAARLGESGGSAKSRRIEWRRLFFIFLGIGLFVAVWLSPPWSPAVDPENTTFVLSREGKAALALFLLAATWWVTEVVPIGITAITIGVVQALFLIRPARDAFTDFMDPSVWFIFGSLMIGVAFTKTGVTRRLAYKMLSIVGERTSMIYLGCFVMTSALTLVMAHTAVAATVYPLFLAIYALYAEDGRPTKFGKGLFVGMAFVAGQRNPTIRTKITTMGRQASRARSHIPQTNGDGIPEDAIRDILGHDATESRQPVEESSAAATKRPFMVPWFTLLPRSRFWSE